ncbi:MAG TPA: metallophosphoesterase [Solirubrobacteraceae bacterium]|jgi:3',5'-cyclic AMP phosphodiesterase CpdA|nr:metallophosphoesterase [Solirubrobacteraceae bacterium]
MESSGSVLIQLGDLHIGADWVERDPLETLSATVDAILRLSARPGAVLALGDLAEHGSDVEYEAAFAELTRLGAPIYVAMGNHDDRERLRLCFGLEVADDAPLRYVTDIGPVRLVVLDTTVPGMEAGNLDGESLTWLDCELSDYPQTTTLLALHHPPLLTGSAAFDRIALTADSRCALARVLERHPQVRRILGAHLHRPLLTEFASRPLLVAPSTYVQFPLDLNAVKLVAGEEPPGFVMHSVNADGSLISTFQTAPDRRTGGSA